MKEMENNSLLLPAEVGRAPKAGMLMWLLPYRTKLWTFDWNRPSTWNTKKSLG
jgi:hypothetical protein